MANPRRGRGDFMNGRGSGTLLPRWVLDLPLTIGQIVLRNLKHSVTTFQIIAVMEGYVVLAREEVLAVVVTLIY